MRPVGDRDEGVRSSRAASPEVEAWSACVEPRQKKNRARVACQNLLKSRAQEYRRDIEATREMTLAITVGSGPIARPEKDT